MFTIGCYQAGAAFIVLFPAIAIMITGFTGGKFQRKHFNRCFFKHASVFAFSATGTMVGINSRYKQCVFAAAQIGPMIERDRLVDGRTDSITDITT